MVLNEQLKLKLDETTRNLEGMNEKIQKLEENVEVVKHTVDGFSQNMCDMVEKLGMLVEKVQTMSTTMTMRAVPQPPPPTYPPKTLGRVGGGLEGKGGLGVGGVGNGDGAPKLESRRASPRKPQPEDLELLIAQGFYFWNDKENVGEYRCFLCAKYCHNGLKAHIETPGKEKDKHDEKMESHGATNQLEKTAGWIWKDMCSYGSGVATTDLVSQSQLLEKWAKVEAAKQALEAAKGEKQTAEAEASPRDERNCEATNQRASWEWWKQDEEAMHEDNNEEWYNNGESQSWTGDWRRPCTGAGYR
jgi:hypothetical protein